MRNRSISKRLLWHDLTMILLPIIVIIFIGITIYSSFILLSDNSSLLSELLMSQTSSYGPSLVVKNLRDDLEQCSSPTDFDHRFAPLVELGFSCHIYKDDTLYYVSSNTTVENNMEVIQKIGYIPSSKEPFHLWNEKGFAYHSVLIQNDSELSLWVCSDDVRWSIQNDIQWQALKSQMKTVIFVSCTVLILFFILVGIYLSRRLSHSFIQPLKELHQASKEIGLNHLDTPIPIQGEGEILELSESFEEMRLQLLEHAHLQAQYEQNRIELLSRIAHDLNTPLAVINGYVNSLIDHLYDDPMKQEAVLKTILSNSHKMHQLIQDLFLYSTLSLDKEHYEDVTFNLVEFIQEYMFDKKFYFQEHQINFTFQSPLSNVMIHMDPKQLMRIFDNFVSNSDKYRKGEYVNVLLSLEESEDEYIISFSDDGIGVQEAELAELFVSFYRSDKARSSTIKGHGLGLSIVNEIIKHYNGSIQARVNKPHGLTMIWKMKKGIAS